MLDMSTINEPTDYFASDLATNIRTLMKLRGIKAARGYEYLHISSGTWFSHMNTGAWSARHIKQLAELLEVSASTLYGKPDELLRTESIASPDLSVIRGGGNGTKPTRGHLTLA